MEPVQPRKVPKDGPGPRGLPDCYYTSRVLNSTFRYVRFVKKLRALEEEQRKGNENNMKELKDKQINHFFARCDRKNLMNQVARRVDLCMQSYQQDLQEKRNRVKDLFLKEEEANIRRLVEQAQEGAALLWQDKLDRLDYLLKKRRKEHLEKYKDTPISKAAHVLPCIYKIRAKEAQEFQLYQMKEKEARKMAEKEFDKMWHEVALKESEALAARMEMDAIERYRRDMDCKKNSDFQLELKRQRRERDREMLKQETLRMKAKFEEDERKEQEAEAQRALKRQQTAADRDAMIEERRQAVAKRTEEEKLLSATWDSLTGQGIQQDKAAEQLRRRKKIELNICNNEMIKLRDAKLKSEECVDELIEQEAKQRQDLPGYQSKVLSLLSIIKTQNEEMINILKQKNDAGATLKADFKFPVNTTEELNAIEIKLKNKDDYYNLDVRKAIVDQIQERQGAREELKKKLEEQDEYQRQVTNQMKQLVSAKELEEAERRKRYQQDLLEQMEYNKLLKERALQEEMDQRKKCELAAKEYEEEIKKMLQRPFYSEEVHPFMKQMAKGLQMAKKCPCSKADYCKYCSA